MKAPHRMERNWGEGTRLRINWAKLKDDSKTPAHQADPSFPERGDCECRGRRLKRLVDLEAERKAVHLDSRELTGQPLEEVTEKTRPPVEPRGGPGNQSPLSSSSLLGMHAPPTVLTGGAV